VRASPPRADRRAFTLLSNSRRATASADTHVRCLARGPGDPGNTPAPYCHRTCATPLQVVSIMNVMADEFWQLSLHAGFAPLRGSSDQISLFDLPVRRFFVAIIGDFLWL